MADEPDTDVTIRNEFGAEKDVPKGAVPYFTNSGWVELDAAGRKKAHQTTTVAPPKES